MSKRAARPALHVEIPSDDDCHQGYPLERTYARRVETTNAARSLAGMSNAPCANAAALRASAERIHGYLAWVLAPVGADREEVGAGEGDPIVEACFHLMEVVEQCCDVPSPIPSDSDGGFSQ